MALMTWTDEAFSVGIPSINAQHKKLVDLINQLHQAMLDGAVADELKTILGELINYTVIHFAYEEKLFAEHGYPEVEGHKAVHEALKAKVVELQNDFIAGKPVMGMEVMNFLREWLTGHIQGDDRKYSQFLIERGVQ